MDDPLELADNPCENLYRLCLRALRAGDLVGLYALLPHFSVCQDPRLVPHFRRLLADSDRRAVTLAACALGALGQAQAIPWLLGRFRDPATYRGPGCQRLQGILLDAVGEIGDDRASDPLMALFADNPPGDPFRARRRLIIVDTLGSIAQQGGQRALQHLQTLLGRSEPLIRAGAITAIATAFWQRPNDLPDPLFERLMSLFADCDLYVQYSLLSAMENLADIGCRRAVALFPDRA